MSTIPSRPRSACLVAAACVLILAACGSQPEAADIAEPDDSSSPSSDTLVDSTADSSPISAPITAEPDGQGAEVDSTAAPLDDVVPVDVSVTASGSGGCVDAVQTSLLDVLGGVGDDVWATFDLVLDNNCGDPGLTVVFDRPDEGTGSDGWRRRAMNTGVSVSGPVCDERVECGDDVRTVELDGPVDRSVGFELFRDDAGPMLIENSPYEMAVVAVYDYGTDLLDDEPIDIVVTVTVGEQVPAPTGATTPTDTGRSPVTIVGAGFDLLTFPLAAFADDPDALVAVLASSARAIDVEALGIDWPREAVVVFSIPTDLCPPVLTGIDVADGVATPAFENPGYLGCEQPLLSHTAIAAVDRDLLEDVTEVRLPPEDPFHDGAATAPVEVTQGSGANPQAPIDDEFGSVSGSIELPAAGEAVVGVLDDGAPVFVVRHRDGTVSALDPRAGAPLEAPSGIFALATWNAANRNFMARGVWDEYGRRIDGFRTTDMNGRATRVVDRDGVAIVEIGGRVEPPVGSPIAVTDAIPAMTDASVDLGTAVALDDALALDVGATAVIDASIVIDPDGAFVCVQDGDGFPLDPCPDGSPTLDGGGATDESRNVFFGPLIATRTETGFIRVAATGGQAGEAI